MNTVADLIKHLGSYQQDTTLEALLEKKEVASLLNRIYTSLPAKNKTAVHRIFRPRKSTNAKKTPNAPLAAVLDVHEISMPEDVCDLFDKCKEDPSLFWESLKLPLEESWDSRSAMEIVAPQTYLTGRSLIKRRKWDTIRWRFFTRFWHKLRLLIGDGQVKLTPGLEYRLVEVISSSESITDDHDTIKRYLRIWTTAGLRYNKICDHLEDEGALFLLPHLSDNVWEDEHSLKGEKFEQAMKHLKTKGIIQESQRLGAASLSKKIQNVVLPPFQWYNDLITSPTTQRSVENTMGNWLGSGPLQNNSNTLARISQTISSSLPHSTNAAEQTFPSTLNPSVYSCPSVPLRQHYEYDTINTSVPQSITGFPDLVPNLGGSMQSLTVQDSWAIPQINSSANAMPVTPLCDPWPNAMPALPPRVNPWPNAMLALPPRVDPWSTAVWVDAPINTNLLANPTSIHGLNVDTGRDSTAISAPSNAESFRTYCVHQHLSNQTTEPEMPGN